MVQCVIYSNMKDMYGPFTIGHSGGTEELFTELLPWLEPMALQEVENRMLKGLFRVEHEYIGLPVYAFNGDGFFHPYSTFTRPTAPYSIWLIIIRVFPIDRMVSADGKSGKMIWHDGDHVRG